MAGSLSTYAEAKMLDHILDQDGSVYTAPTELWIALSTGTIDDATTGGTIVEPAGGFAYARVQQDDWDTANGGRVTENTGAIEFVEATDDWLTITDWAVIDADSGGNIIAYGTFTDSGKAVGTGDNASIADGGIDIEVLTGGMSNYLASAMLDHFFGNTTYTAAGSLYVGLSTGTIADGSSGDGCAEVALGTYARVQTDDWNAADSTLGTTANTAAITFAQATVSWGTVRDFFVADSLTAGNILFYATASATKAVGANDTVQFDAGSFAISLD